VQLKDVTGKRFRLLRFNSAAAVNNLELVHRGPVTDLQKPLQVQLEPYGIRWLTIDRQ
jgi:hypothetical protein